jgi:hypothetical protein
LLDFSQINGVPLIHAKRVLPNARARFHFADGSIKVLEKSCGQVLPTKKGDQKGDKRLGKDLVPAGMTNFLIQQWKLLQYNLRLDAHTLCRHGTDSCSLVNINDTLIIRYGPVGCCFDRRSCSDYRSRT